MKKEIGGYFELEDFGGKEYYPNLYKVNLGRTALRWLLEGRGYTKIYHAYRGFLSGDGSSTQR